MFSMLLLLERSYHYGHEIPFVCRKFLRGGLVFLFSFVLATKDFGHVCVLETWILGGISYKSESTFFSSIL
jgi:hypothetical protein